MSLGPNLESPAQLNRQLICSNKFPSFTSMNFSQNSDFSPLFPEIKVPENSILFWREETFQKQVSVRFRKHARSDSPENSLSNTSEDGSHAAFEQINLSITSPENFAFCPTKIPSVLSGSANKQSSAYAQIRVLAEPPKSRHLVLFLKPTNP